MESTTSRNLICPYCRSKATAWKGYRPRAHDRVRLRGCTHCGRKYTTSEIVLPKRKRGRPVRLSKSIR